MRRRIAIAAGLAALALGGAAVAALAGGATVHRTTVQVTEREYRVSLSARNLPSGIVRLVVHNAGHVAHRLSIAGPRLKTTTTPLIQPGATRTLTVTLGGGSYTLWCPLGGHAARGMKTSLTARGSFAPPISTSPDTATTGGDGY